MDSELIAALEAAEGPDRELDCQISLAIGGRVTPHYTASLDTIVGLIERELPEWRWYVDNRTAAVWPDGTYDESSVGASTPALALCIAFLRARAEKEQGK
jgi:hypothetical protein